jgi:hypothetical protein
LLKENRVLQAKSEQPGPGGLHTFTDVPPGVYTIVAAAPRFNPGRIENAKVKSRGKVTHRIVLSPTTVRIPDRYTYRFALERGEDIEEFRTRAGKIYGARYKDNEKRIVRVGENPDVASSEPYKRAVEFFEKAITNEEVPVEVLAKSYIKVANGLVRSVMHPSSDAEKKKAMRAVLIDVTGAYLDRVTLDQPDELSPAVVNSVETVSFALRRSDVAANAFKTSWKSANLFNELGSEMAVKLADMIQ